MRGETLTLLCFSYAGGSSAFYSRSSKLLPAVRVVPVEIPGRGTEHQIALLVSSAGLLDFLMNRYRHFCTEPFVLFGHSLGARIAFEFLHMLEQTHGLKAQRLFVSGCLAPDRFALAMGIREHDLSDSSLLQVLADLGGTPPELMANAQLMKALANSPGRLSPSHRFVQKPGGVYCRTYQPVVGLPGSSDQTVRGLPQLDPSHFPGM